MPKGPINLKSDISPVFTQHWHDADDISFTLKPFWGSTNENTHDFMWHQSLPDDSVDRFDPKAATLTPSVALLALSACCTPDTAFCVCTCLWISQNASSPRESGGGSLVQHYFITQHTRSIPGDILAKKKMWLFPFKLQQTSEKFRYIPSNKGMTF